MRCGACGRRIYWIEFVENLGACNKCMHRKLAPKSFVEGIKLGMVAGVIVLMVLILFIYHLVLWACPS